jgi:class 3 adenylate cyclase
MDPSRKHSEPTDLSATERHYATVMFADITGFTAMSERLDPEEVHSIRDHRNRGRTPGMCHVRA